MEAAVERGGVEGAANAAAGANDAGGADPFGFELFRNAIFAIADEMALTVCRTTYSGVLRDNMDFSTALTDGEASFEDWIDDDGIDRGKPIRLFVTLRKEGDSLHADWAGSSPQVKGAINSTLSWTKAATYTAIRSVLPPGIPPLHCSAFGKESARTQQIL